MESGSRPHLQESAACLVHETGGTLLPVGRVLWHRVQCPPGPLGHLVVGHVARPAGPTIVRQALRACKPLGASRMSFMSIMSAFLMPMPPQLDSLIDEAVPGRDREIYVRVDDVAGCGAQGAVKCARMRRSSAVGFLVKCRQTLGQVSSDFAPSGMPESADGTCLPSSWP